MSNKIISILSNVESLFDLKKIKISQPDVKEVKEDDKLRHKPISDYLSKFNDNIEILHLCYGKDSLLNLIQEEHPKFKQYGLDITKVSNNNSKIKLFQGDVFTLFDFDLRCELCVMLNMFHHPKAWGIPYGKQRDRKMEILEAKLLSMFDNIIVNLNEEQLNSYQLGFGLHNKEMKVKVINKIFGNIYHVQCN